MHELIRDTAFGKLVRISSGHRLFRYPEELDPSIASEYINRAAEEGDTALEPGPNGNITDPNGLETIMSQASYRSRRGSIRTSSYRDEKTAMVNWQRGDSENPQNWSFGKKLFVSSLVWLLTFAVYIGSAIYSPAIPQVAEEFGVSNVVSTLGLTLFVLGYGIGPMIWSPLSELPTVGRSPVYVLTLLVFVFLNFAVVYAKSIATLMVLRFITGFIGSPALATGGASMSDIWSPRARDYMIVIWGAFAIAAPVLGPMVGGFALPAEGWTWTIWQLIWVSAFALVLLFFLLPETYGPNILYRRARRLRRISQKPFYCEAELELRSITSTEILFEALVRPFHLCFYEPIVLVMNIYISLVYGILYIWFEAFPIVFQEIHGFNSGESGMAFLGIIVGTLCFAVPGYFSWKYFYQSKQVTSTPESQLPPAIVGSICLPISLFWFGWTGNFESVHWIVPIMASTLFSVGGCLIFNPIFCYLAHAYPRYAASVLAGNDFMRSSFGAGFPLFATAMFHNLGVGWACTLLGCLTCLFIPFPLIFYWRGKQLRLKSRFARHDI
ncbi:synaptic vesicle transporter [Aspergillus minisclerotigenes]|uniref:Synaptic vesicle transporter n=1 Tax=Aspergillus minisclerotigenes TaxID=656917 RepID=A0A5N6IP10_9EURO|nr:synaptic vesicle transporter [Aspergillus minisclerotigenes]